ncbi:MAG: hypothetical protein ABSA47_17600 [Verrucomicrobiota bacterium]
MIASIGLNLMLVAAWYIADLQEDHSPPVHEPVLAEPRIKTNVVVRLQNMTWGDIASPYLSNFVVNLHAMGCPNGTIRDIVLGEVNRTFARRRSLEIVTPDQQWWRSDPDPAVADAAASQFRELESQRRATLDNLLSSVLGTNWETETDLLAWLVSNYGLTGPQLGELSPETKRAVYDIATRAQEELRGQNPMEMARIWQNERLELAALLPPAPLSEYLLRYSPTSQRIRDQTRGFNLSPDQFQSLFAAVDPIVMDPDFYYQGGNAESRQRQQALQAQYQADLKLALGDAAYASLQLNQDPLYASARDAALQAGIPAQAVLPLYEINRATQTELNRIRADPTMSDEDKIDALANTRAEAQKSIEQLIGADAFQRWLQTQTKP